MSQRTASVRQAQANTTRAMIVARAAVRSNHDRRRWKLVRHVIVTGCIEPHGVRIVVRHDRRANTCRTGDVMREQSSTDKAQFAGLRGCTDVGSVQNSNGRIASN